jgi:hypothetical protein
MNFTELTDLEDKKLQFVDTRKEIVQPPNQQLLFQMKDKIPNESRTYHDALHGNMYDTVLSSAYFSGENQDILQNAIRKGVYDKSNGKHIVSRQDPDGLKAIMRSIFLQHSPNNPNDITEQIKMLNELVINYAVPRVYSNVESYLHYRNDSENIHEPIARPIMTKRTMQLQPRFW